MDKATFRTVFGAVYEHSPWLADEVFDTGIDPILADADALSSRFASVFLAAEKARQLVVLKAHPQLACARAEYADLTPASIREQTGAGLDQCTESEFNQFIDMNEKYMKKNKFPFIIAVKGRHRQEILEAFKNRLDNDSSKEFKTALEQVCQIAKFRIRDILRG